MTAPDLAATVAAFRQDMLDHADETNDAMIVHQLEVARMLARLPQTATTAALTAAALSLAGDAA